MRIDWSCHTYRNLIYICSILFVFCVVIGCSTYSVSTYSSDGSSGLNDSLDTTKQRENSPAGDSDDKTESETFGSFSEIESLNQHSDSSFVGGSEINNITAAESFYYEELPDEVKAGMIGTSYPENTDEALIALDKLCLVHLLYVDFDGNTQQGSMIVNTEIADDVIDIFSELYDARYQIEKIRLIDEYGGDDEDSMADNNTSCFNYRVISDTDYLSYHAYGCAIDLNPLYNPCIYSSGIYYPKNAAPYVDRSAEFSHKIDETDLAYQVFTDHGFTWGGHWNNPKDYQHFQKVLT